MLPAQTPALKLTYLHLLHRMYCIYVFRMILTINSSHLRNNVNNLIFVIDTVCFLRGRNWIKKIIWLNFGIHTGKPSVHYVPSGIGNKRCTFPDVLLQILAPCVVCIVVRLWSVRPRKQGLIPSRGKRLFFKVPRLALESSHVPHWIPQALPRE